MLNLKRLPNCAPDEEVVHFLRRHHVTLAGLAVSYLALLLLPFLIGWYLVSFQPGVVYHPIWMPLIALAGSFFWLYAWLFLFQGFMDYHLDVWIVTNQRILNIEQVGLFSRTVSELRLYRIQDVTSTVTGPLHTILDYGDVEIQTAGEKEHFLFEDIPHPNAISKSISDLAEIDRKKHLDEAVEEFETPEPRR